MQFFVYDPNWNPATAEPPCPEEMIEMQKLEEEGTKAGWLISTGYGNLEEEAIKAGGLASIGALPPKGILLQLSDGKFTVTATTEALSFDRPAFLLNGKRLVQYWASKGHCSLYVMTPAFVEAHAEDLAGYDVSGATIRFSADKLLPAVLVEKLIKARVAEHKEPLTKTKPTKWQTKMQ